MNDDIEYPIGCPCLYKNVEFEVVDVDGDWRFIEYLGPFGMVGIWAGLHELRPLKGGEMIQGQRFDLPDDKTFPEPGQYGKGHDGEWYGCLPVPVDADGFPLVANLQSHQVTEHEDGTITVKPSILVVRRHTKQMWHGFLDRGNWLEV